MHVLEAGIAALREGAQKVERRRRLPVGHLLARRIGHARLRVELDAVDDVAAIARQRHAVDRLVVGRARLGELAGDAADLHHRLGAGEGQHHRHLQEHAEEVADVVRAMLGEAFGAIAALQEEPVSGSDGSKLLLQLARLTCKNQRRKGRETGLGLLERSHVRIGRHLLDRLCSPGIRRPFRHFSTQQLWLFRRTSDGDCPGLAGNAALYRNPTAHSRPERSRNRMCGRRAMCERDRARRPQDDGGPSR